MTYKIMSRRITAVEVSYDKLSESDIKVGSADWFGWLECNRSFHYSCSKGHFTANKNSKGYWYAQRRVRGELLQHYMGQAAKLTLESLLDAAEKLALAEINNRPSNKLVRVLEEQSCKSCMTEEERLSQLSREELIELAAHLKNQLHDYKTQPKDSSQTSDEIENLQARLAKLEAEKEGLERKLKVAGELSETEEIRRLNAELRLEREQKESYRSKWERGQKDNSAFFLELKIQRAALEELENQLSERSLEELNEYLAEVKGIPLDDKGKPKARYDQLAKFKTWLESKKRSLIQR